jgi:hypothetical protein
MRFSRILLAVSLSTGLVFAGTTATTTTTATPTAEKAPAKAPVQALVKVAGTVDAVDAIGNTLIIKTAKKTDTVSVSTDTKITNAGKVVTLSDLKTGENVRALCKKDEGKLVATDVKVGVAAAKKPATTTTTTTTTTTAPTTTEKK